MNKSWQVVYYALQDGTEPATVFLHSLPIKDREKMVRCIELLVQLGIHIRFPHARAIEGETNLFELRSKVGNNIQRILYFHYTGKLFVLLNGFTKKDNKTPAQEIQRAKQYRQDFLNTIEE